MDTIIANWSRILGTASQQATSSGVVKSFLKQPSEKTKREVGLFSLHGDLAKETMKALNEGKLTAEQLAELVK